FLNWPRDHDSNQWAKRLKPPNWLPAHYFQWDGDPEKYARHFMSPFHYSSGPPTPPDTLRSASAFQPKPDTWTFDEFSCEEFPHRADPERLLMEVLAGPELRERGGGGAVRCRIHARNLPRPVECDLPVRVTVEDGDIESELRRIIPQLPE